MYTNFSLHLYDSIFFLFVSLYCYSAERKILIYSIAFAKAYTINSTVQEAKVRGIFVFLFNTIHFICMQIFNNFQKYHWIQHTNLQPVVVTTERNILLLTNLANVKYIQKSKNSIIFSKKLFFVSLIASKLFKLKITNMYKKFSTLVEHNSLGLKNDRSCVMTVRSI